MLLAVVSWFVKFSKFVLSHSLAQNHKIIRLRKLQRLAVIVSKVDSTSFALFGRHETRILEKGKALKFQNIFCHES